MTDHAAPTMDTLNAFIRAACFLRKETIGRESTAAFLQDDPQNNRVLYALDTGLIKANADPTTTGPLPKDGQNGYGYVFPGDESDKGAQIKLAAALSNYICYELNPKDLMYQLPGHAEETERVYAAIAQKIEARGRPDYVKKSDWEMAQVARSIERLSQDNDLILETRALAERMANDGADAARDDQVSAIIERFVGKIVDTYQQFNRTEHEYLNYLRLLVRRGLAPLDKAARALSTDPHNRDLAYAFEAVDLDKRSFSEVVRHNQLVTLWMARIGSLKSKNSRTLTNDAEALASLELVNQRLRNLSGHTRMVLLTCDKHLVEAASRRMPYGENVNQGFDADYFRKFGQNHVQHLHAFLSECLVDTDDKATRIGAVETGNAAGRIVSWLDAFLGEKAGMTEFAPDTLAQITYDEGEATAFARALWGQLGENGADFQTILEQWREIRSQASNRELFVEQLDRVELLSDTVRKVVTSIVANNSEVLHGDPVAFLATTANEISENLWEAFVVSLSTSGARLLVADDGDRSRNPPDIRFDSLLKAGEIVRKLIDRNGFSSEIELAEALGQLKHDTLEKVPGNNALGYLYYLVMAAIFAKNSRWSVTYTLAQRAIAIVESRNRRHQEIQVQRGSNISGREAYYVAAIAKRLLARYWLDFDIADRHLAAAHGALDADHKKGTALQQKGRRFQVEEMALNLSRFHWTRYCWHETEGLEREEEMFASLERAMATCCSLDQDIQALKKSYRKLRRSTLVNYATNIVQIAVARAMLGDFAPTPPAGRYPEDHLDDAISLLEGLTVVGEPAPQTADPGSTPNRSYLIKVYLVAGRILRSQAMSRREILQLFSEDSMQNHAVTLYDLARFRELKDFCIDRCTT